MAKQNSSHIFERLQFFNGQRLFASDLQAMEIHNRELRWLHNSSLHQPGIGNGFAVSGNKGEREVTIGPGYALDCYGREIVLTETHVKPLPPVAGEDDGSPVFYDLTVSYPEDSEIEESESRQGICLPRGVVRLQEEPVFCWVRLERDSRENLHAWDENLRKDIEGSRKIILARVQVLNCQLYQLISTAQRRSARPPRQPYIACGQEKPTEWEIWPQITSEEFEERVKNVKEIASQCPIFIYPVGLQASITTERAKFVNAPFYSSHIVGPRIRYDSAGKPYVFDSLLNIDDVTPKGFRVFVLILIQLPPTDKGSPELKDFSPIVEMKKAATADEKEAIKRFLQIFSDWHVVWQGIEG